MGFNQSQIDKVLPELNTETKNEAHAIQQLASKCRNTIGWIDVDREIFSNDYHWNQRRKGLAILAAIAWKRNF